MISYPNPPGMPSSPSAFGLFILQILFWILETIAIGIANVFIAVFGGFASGAGSSGQAVSGFIGATWDQSVHAFAAYGVFAPVIASAVWGISVLILVFFVFKAIQLSMAETTDDV